MYSLYYHNHMGVFPPVLLADYSIKKNMKIIFNVSTYK